MILGNLATIKKNRNNYRKNKDYFYKIRTQMDYTLKRQTLKKIERRRKRTTIMLFNKLWNKGYKSKKFVINLKEKEKGKKEKKEVIFKRK